MTRCTRTTRSLLRAGIGVGAATAVLLLAATPAFAHVEAKGDTAATGITTVKFSFTHGCSGSPTTSLKVQFPEGTSEVTAVNPAGWTSAVSANTLTWSGGSIPDPTPGAFQADMRLVGAQGATVFLPTIQGCAQGEETWIELTPDPEAENAAPRIELTQTVAASPTSSTTEASVTTTSAVTASTKTSAQEADAKVVKDSENSNIGVIIFGIVVVIIVGGGVILYLRNRRQSQS
jgi:uncharacterized protein YcnI